MTLSYYQATLAIYHNFSMIILGKTVCMTTCACRIMACILRGGSCIYSKPSSITIYNAHAVLLGKMLHNAGHAAHFNAGFHAMRDYVQGKVQTSMSCVLSAAVRRSTKAAQANALMDRTLKPEAFANIGRIS